MVLFEAQVVPEHLPVNRSGAWIGKLDKVDL